MRTSCCSGRKSDVGARLAVKAIESGAENSEDGGRMVPIMFLCNLDNDLRAGRAMTYGPVGGKTISEAEGYRIVAHARAEGWLPPYSPTI
jgi:hypothetical protein